MIKANLKTVGKEYKGQGETVDEALGNMGITWEKIKGKGVITITDGVKTHEHLFYLSQLRKLFGNHTTRALWGKRLTILLS